MNCTKTLHAISPRLNSMQGRKPDLYPSCLCRQCELKDKDKSQHDTGVQSSDCKLVDLLVPNHWHPPSDTDYVRGFSFVGGARAEYGGEPALDREKNLKWRVSYFLCRITPKSILDEWSSVLRTPKSIAKTVVHKFVGYLEAQGSALIRKPQCSVKIAWDQTQVIFTKAKTTKAKTTKYVGLSGDWTRGHGYIV
ncbi:hypothetical protein BGZ96_007085 [Linnemannia gamsii]|uniref:Uncharacterized protein n=1 Tax=Linnemannia gamsii TaxID=64522 RepID=A0ABQ7K2B8_9FUNG|nr:hypothetical protein BGZ96_007085 [Linnemannia gamsii]